MKNRTKGLIILLLLIVQHSHQLIRDISFLRFCTNVGKDTVMVEGDLQTSGDKCTVVYPFPAADNDEAKEYCNQWNMYPVIESKVSGGQVQCTYENVYECRPDYTLINGYCYRIVSQKLITYGQAEKACEDEVIPSINQNNNVKIEAKIMKLFDRDYLIRIFRAYFTNMKMFFIQNIKQMISDLDYVGDSDEYALAFSMAQFYKTGPGAVIKLPTGRKAQAMCVYRAEDTPLSFAYKARMFEPYYYPMHIDSQMVVIRTAGQYSVMRENNLQIAVQKCEASMKAVLGTSSKGDVWDGSQNNIAMLTQDFKKSIVKATTPLVYCCFYTDSYYNYYYERFSGQCDNGDWTHLVVLMSQARKSWNCKQQENVYYDYRYYTDDGYYPREYSQQLPITYTFLPNSRIVARHHHIDDAPVLCTLDFNLLKKPNKCEDGWSPYLRSNTLTVCHRAFFNKLNYDNALAQCKKEGGSLSTFTSDAELDLINKLSNPNGVTVKDDNIRVWLGLNKIKKCPRATTGDCEREKIVEFVDPLFGEDTPETRACIAKSWQRSNIYREDQPNHWDVQWCIDKGPWHERSPGLLNDAWCHSQWHYSCIKAATLYQ